MIGTGTWRKPVVNRLEQVFAVIITTGLVLGNFLLFTPWRDGQDPRERNGHASPDPTEAKGRPTKGNPKSN